MLLTNLINNLLVYNTLHINKTCTTFLRKLWRSGTDPFHFYFTGIFGMLLSDAKLCNKFEFNSFSS